MIFYGPRSTAHGQKFSTLRVEGEEGLDMMYYSFKLTERR